MVGAPVYFGGDRREERDLEQLHLVLGFDGIAYDDPDYYPLQVLSMALGGGMSSRLFQEVREKRGLAYAIYSFASSYIDGGLFGIYAGCGAEQAVELVRVISDELIGITDEIRNDELQRAQAQLKAGILMAQESSSARAEQAGRQMLVFGRLIPPSEIVARIEALGAAEVAAAARRLVQGRRLTVSAVGPTGQVSDYDRLAARFL